MESSQAINSDQWNDNSTVLIQSNLSRIHRDLLLQKSLFNRLIIDKDSKILDLGCGSGPFLAYFASQGFQHLYGIEPEQELIKKIPQSIKADVRNDRAEQLSFDANMFDAVFIYGVLHHLKGLDAYQKACREIERVLKPGGYVFIMEPGRYWLFRLMTLAVNMLGSLSHTFKALSQCIKEEEVDVHNFLKNHSAFRKYFQGRLFNTYVDKYIIYSWIFTAQKVQ